MNKEIEISDELLNEVIEKFNEVNEAEAYDEYGDEDDEFKEGIDEILHELKTIRYKRL